MLTFPDAYRPFETLYFASNVLENVRAPLLFKDRPVLLVGPGDRFPRVWLSVPRSGPDEEWVDVVADNELIFEGMPTLPFRPIDVRQLEHPLPTVEVWSGGNFPMLRVRQEDRLVGRIDYVDLRPLGVNITGSSEGLSVGGASFSHNTFKNSPSMVTVG